MTEHVAKKQANLPGAAFHLTTTTPDTSYAEQKTPPHLQSPFIRALPWVLEPIVNDGAAQAQKSTAGKAVKQGTAIDPIGLALMSLIY
jgi:hypothetical protein